MMYIKDVCIEGRGCPKSDLVVVRGVALKCGRSVQKADGGRGIRSLKKYGRDVL